VVTVPMKIRLLIAESAEKCSAILHGIVDQSTVLCTNLESNPRG
jgi:hypothetical protein